MMKIIQILLIFSYTFCYPQVNPLDWVKNKPVSQISMATDFDNNIIQVKRKNNTDNSSSLIEKLDPEGNILWTKEINTLEKLKVKTDLSGNIYVGGSFSNIVDFDPGPNLHNIQAENKDAFLLKLNSIGDFIWVKIFSTNGEDKLGGLEIINNFIYLTGDPEEYLDVDPSDNEFLVLDHFVLKLNLNGEFIFAKSIETDSDIATSIKVDANENYYISGYKKIWDLCDSSYPSYYCEQGTYIVIGIETFITKYNLDGDLIWNRKISEISGYYYYPSDGGIALSKNDESIVLTGRFYGTRDFDYGPEEHILTSSFGANFTLKLDVNGDFLWVYADTEFDAGYAKYIVVDELNNTYTLGDYVNSGYFIRKNDSEGNLIWNHLSGEGVLYQTGPFNPTNYTDVYGLVLDKNQNIIYAGRAITNDDLDPSDNVYSLDSNDSFISKLKKDNSLNTKDYNTIKLKAYPNPTKDFLQIENRTISQIKSIKVYNIEGKLITSQINTNKLIDLTNYSKGFYFVKIKTENDVFNLKVLKN